MPRPPSTSPTISPQNWSLPKRRAALSLLPVWLVSFQHPFRACTVLPRYALLLFFNGCWFCFVCVSMCVRACGFRSFISCHFTYCRTRISDNFSFRTFDLFSLSLSFFLSRHFAVNWLAVCTLNCNPWALTCVLCIHPPWPVIFTTI